MGTRRFGLLAAVLVLLLAGIPAAAGPPLERFIVVLNPGSSQVPAVAQELAAAHGGEIGFVYQYALQGFSVLLPAPAAAALSQNPQVAYIEPDVEVAVTQTGTQPIPTHIDRIDADLNPPRSSMPVDIAIIDTGIYIGTTANGQARSHYDLNLSFVTDCTQAIFYPTFGGCSGSGNFQDENGHGTHVAGIAAAYDNDIGTVGAAPGAVLWSVKALGADGSGFLGSILAAIDFVTSQAAAIEVANMSFGFTGSSDALNTAISNSVAAGVVYVAAAGNSSADAATFSPASHPDVITVSAMADFDGLPGGLGSPTCRDDQDDTLADFSNYGSTVDIAAPGVCIYSTFLNDGYTTYSGTSMASPLVAGVVARYIAQSGFNPASRADVLAIRDLVVGAAVPQGSACGFTGDPDASLEPLVTVNSALFGGTGGCGAGEPPPPPPPAENQPPVASFDHSCSGLTCTFTDASTDSDGTISSRSWSFGDGATASGAQVSHTYPAGGSYGVVLTVSDDDGATATAGATVTVSEPQPQPTAMTAAVYPILLSGRSASVTVEVFDADGVDIAGATISGQWSFVNKQGKVSIRNRSGTTGADGTYTFLESFPPGTSGIRFCVLDVAKSGYTYVPSPITCAVPLE